MIPTNDITFGVIWNLVTYAAVLSRCSATVMQAKEVGGFAFYWKRIMRNIVL